MPDRVRRVHAMACNGRPEERQVEGRVAIATMNRHNRGRIASPRYHHMGGSEAGHYHSVLVFQTKALQLAVIQRQHLRFAILALVHRRPVHSHSRRRVIVITRHLTCQMRGASQRAKRRWQSVLLDLEVSWLTLQYQFRSPRANIRPRAPRSPHDRRETRTANRRHAETPASQSDYSCLIALPSRAQACNAKNLSLIHISEPTRLGMISYAVFCLKKKKK